MKGLLYKEWATLTSSYKQTVFFIAFLYGGISILTGQTGMAYALLVVFSILITSTISFDENSHWDIYVRTLPVTPAQQIPVWAVRAGVGHSVYGADRGAEQCAAAPAVLAHRV